MNTAVKTPRWALRKVQAPEFINLLTFTKEHSTYKRTHFIKVHKFARQQI